MKMEKTREYGFFRHFRDFLPQTWFLANFLVEKPDSPGFSRIFDHFFAKNSQKFKNWPKRTPEA